MADDKEKKYNQIVRDQSKLDYWDEKRVRQIVRQEIKRDNGSNAMGCVVTIVVFWIAALTVIVLDIHPEYLRTTISRLLHGG